MERLELWDDIYNLGQNIKLSWIVGGDFNEVMNEEEKIEGLLAYPNDYEDFTFCINSCELFDINFK